jgi:uncharacterized membrane protein
MVRRADAEADTPAVRWAAVARSAVLCRVGVSRVPRPDAVTRVAAELMSRPGILGAALFFCVSLTPSLLPRTWQVQGVISGASASVGYATGVGFAWLWSRLVRGRLSMPRALWRAVRPVLGAGAIVLVGGSIYQGSRWQRDLHALMGERPPSRAVYLGVLLLSALLMAAVIGVARALRALARALARFLRRFIPPLPARFAGFAVVVLLVVGLLDGLVYDGFLAMATSTARNLNNAYRTVGPVPTSPNRSGSPRSLVSWDSLGSRGREFVAGGPSVEQLRRFVGSRAREPIRAYVGMESTPTIREAAALAVRELERTDAFSRSVLVVVTTTGTGWVDPYLADALEYMYGGDTAMVGVQYSYLPSWISFLSEHERVRQAGRELFDQVHRRWSEVPAARRPRLLVLGESLGSLGSEAAFRDLDDLRARVDGALWAGPVNANGLWAELVAERDPGTPEVLPIYQGGVTVRFASRPADLQRPSSLWSTPRVVYLQNPSDPVTWWSPRLLLRRPDWLTEPRGHDVLPAMRWYPFVTFLQVTADLVLAERAPGGHGHDFDRAAVAAWAAVARPPGWSDARTQELVRLLDAPRWSEVRPAG